MKRRVGITTLALIALLVVPSGTRASDAGDIEDLLRTRAQALNSSDREAFMSTLDPRNAEFVGAQERLFNSVVKLPISNFALKLFDDEPELTREKDRRKYGDQVIVAPVIERYVLNGYDERPAIRELILTFVKQGQEWRIASDTDTEDLGEFTDRDLWEFGDVVTRTSAHFILLLHPEEASFAEELLASAEAALPAVDHVWQSEWSKKTPILVPSTKAELERLIEATFDVSNFVAFATSGLDREDADAWDVVGTRIILNRQNFLRHNQQGRTRILVHELVHVATRGATGPFLPAFAEEGLAELSGTLTTPILDRKVKDGRFDRRLPEDWEFTAGEGGDILTSYQESVSAFKYMKEKFGIEGVNRFYLALGRVRLEPGTGEYRLGKAFQDALGVAFNDFESQWASAVAVAAR